MATDKFNSLILSAASSLQAARSTAGPAGDSASNGFTSSKLSDYANRAARDLIFDTFSQLKENFGNSLPEYVKHAVLTLASGAAAIPADGWLVLDVETADLSVKFIHLEGKEVDDVMTGQDGMMDPTPTQPVFWQEGLNLYTLGITAGNVLIRYIMTHPDIVVITDAVGNGKIYTTAANLSWKAATRTLTVAGDIADYTAADVNKLVFFRTATIVYPGRIQAVNVGLANTDIIISGDGLPAGDIAAPNIIEFIRSDVSPDANDIPLAKNNFEKLLQRILAMAHTDLAVKV